MGLLFFGFEPFTGIRTGKTGLIPVISAIRRGVKMCLLTHFIVGFGVFSSLPECFEIKTAISSTVFVTLALGFLNKSEGITNCPRAFASRFDRFAWPPPRFGVNSQRNTI